MDIVQLPTATEVTRTSFNPQTAVAIVQDREGSGWGRVAQASLAKPTELRSKEKAV